jgi:hypothetical protein
MLMARQWHGSSWLSGLGGQDVLDAGADKCPGQLGASCPPLFGDRRFGFVPALVNVTENVSRCIQAGG